MGDHYGTFRTETATGYAGVAVTPQESPSDALAKRQQAVRDLLASKAVETEEDKSFLEKLILKYIPGPPFGTQYGDTQPSGPGVASTPRPQKVIPRTSGRVPRREAAGRVQGQGIIESAYDRYRSLIEGQLQDDLDRISGDYRDRISALQDEISGYKTGVGEINAEYAEYTDISNEINEPLADLEAEPLGDSTVDENITAIGEDFGGTIAEALGKMAELTPEMAAAMNDELLFMEDAIVDGIRAKTMSQSEMHRLASVNASALATLAWKDDIFNAERARFQIEVQIEKAISDKQEELEDVQAAMARAIADRRAEQGQFNIDPDDLWNSAALDFLSGRELDDNERQDIMSLWQQIFDGDPQAIVDFDTFKSAVIVRINETNLRSLGIFNKINDLRNAIRSIVTDDPLNPVGFNTEELDARIANIVNSPTMERDLRQLVALAENYGFSSIVRTWGLDDADWDSLEDINSNKFQSMFDMWSVHKQFRAEYNDFIENQNAGYTSGGQAANNYANRNKPEYVYRRETTAYWFADALKARFPGVEIGALGYIRDVNDVGGARAVNSDHQSGGAIDVYWKRGTTAEKNAKMSEINAWLRSQGGVSFTNWYDGKSHVHVSFLLGWRIPSRA